MDSGVVGRHADWIAARQRPEGGFGGREGEPDCYYTAFALRSLWIAGRLNESIATPAAAFLRTAMTRRDSVVDLISLIFAAAVCELGAGVAVLSDDDDSWRHNVAAMLSTLRTDDGGFAKTPEGRAGSTYQTFLSVLCHELMDVPVPEADRVVRFIESQGMDGGGYREIRVAKRPGVNPTAAAIGTLKVLGRLEPDQHSETVEFLAEMQTDDGGLTANTRIPFADLLSTCTGLITLSDLSATERVDLDAMGRYASSMQHPGGGGFVGFELDDTADVEYTFYGLATMSLLASA